MSDTERELTLIRRAFEKLDRGLIVITQAWRVGMISKRAQQWLSKYFGGEAAPKGSVPEPLQEWILEQETNLTKNHGDEIRYTTLAVRGSGERLSASLISDSDQRILILKEHSRAIPPVPIDGFGLTRRESEVLNWLVQGKTNEEIAQILAISRRTVGKHLEHVYAKIGVETRISAATFVFSSNQRL